MRTVHIHIHTADSGGGFDESKHPRDHGKFATSAGGSSVERPKTRPDGAAVVDSPKAGSPAERRGVARGKKVSYNYTDAHGKYFTGAGIVVGFAHNKAPGSNDVVIHDAKRGSFLFVDSKNVRLLNYRK